MLRVREKERRCSPCEARADTHSFWPIVTHEFSIQDGSFKTQLPQTLQGFTEDEMWLFWHTTKSTWMLLSFFVSLFTAVGTAVKPIATERECEWGILLMVRWYDFNDHPLTSLLYLCTFHSVSNDSNECEFAHWLSGKNTWEDMLEIQTLIHMDIQH